MSKVHSKSKATGPLPILAASIIAAAAFGPAASAAMYSGKYSCKQMTSEMSFDYDEASKVVRNVTIEMICPDGQVGVGLEERTLYQVLDDGTVKASDGSVLGKRLSDGTFSGQFREGLSSQCGGKDVPWCSEWRASPK
jgi:hypothetical protein